MDDGKFNSSTIAKFLFVLSLKNYCFYINDHFFIKIFDMASFTQVPCLGLPYFQTSLKFPCQTISTTQQTCHPSNSLPPFSSNVYFLNFSNLEKSVYGSWQVYFEYHGKFKSNTMENLFSIDLTVDLKFIAQLCLWQPGIVNKGLFSKNIRNCVVFLSAALSGICLLGSMSIHASPAFALLCREPNFDVLQSCLTFISDFSDINRAGS